VGKLPPRNGEKRIRAINTLLVDGNALFKIGFYGAKDEYNHRGEHIGGVYQFLTVLRKLLTENLYHRVYVFWDGKLSGKLRYNLYPPYKSDRGKDYVNGTYPVDENEELQKKMIWNYLEELCIRQMRHEVVESDDMIAYYVLNKKEHENITICTNDRDYLQLLREQVRIYYCDLKCYVDTTNFSSYFCYHIDNALLVKTIIGDTSDSIKGIKGIKDKKLLEFFPEIAERKVLLTELLEKAKLLQEERTSNKKKPLQALDNLINCVTDGVQGNRLYEINTALIDLSNPFVTADAIDELHTLIDGEFDMSDRGVKNVFQQMKVDGIDRVIGSHRYPDYLVPFKQLIERELKTNKTQQND
jgi:5'-3' exonuclease